MDLPLIRVILAGWMDRRIFSHEFFTKFASWCISWLSSAFCVLYIGLASCLCEFWPMESPTILSRWFLKMTGCCFPLLSCSLQYIFDPFVDFFVSGFLASTIPGISHCACRIFCFIFVIRVMWSLWLRKKLFCVFLWGIGKEWFRPWRWALHLLEQCASWLFGGQDEGQRFAAWRHWISCLGGHFLPGRQGRRAASGEGISEEELELLPVLRLLRRPFRPWWPCPQGPSGGASAVTGEQMSWPCRTNIHQTTELMHTGKNENVISNTWNYLVLQHPCSTSCVEGPLKLTVGLDGSHWKSENWMLHSCWPYIRMTNTPLIYCCVSMW